MSYLAKVKVESRPVTKLRLIALSTKPALAFFLVLFVILACRSTNQQNAPSWTKAKVLSEKEDHPSKIFSDGDAVYFVAGGTVASMNEGTNNIKKISLKDGTVSILVKGGRAIPDTTLAIDDKFVYWSDGGNIMRVPKGGGESEKIIPNAPKPDEIVMDDGYIYYFDHVPISGSFGPVALRKVPKNGGEPVELDQGNAGWINYLAFDAKQVYFTDISKVYGLAK